MSWHVRTVCHRPASGDDFAAPLWTLSSKTATKALNT
jgi:hypothetical protein